jgi:hypothetical protein
MSKDFNPLSGDRLLVLETDLNPLTERTTAYQLPMQVSRECGFHSIQL